jgi:hypothetical protein
MTALSPDAHAHFVRNEMSNLALQVHKLTTEAGGDWNDAVQALGNVEQILNGTRKALHELGWPERAGNGGTT